MELMLTRQQLLTAETAVVGSLLIDPEHVLGTVMQELTPAHFLTPALRHIFEAIRGLWMEQTPVDPVTVLDVIGGGYGQTLREIMDATPTAANVETYIKTVKRLSRTAQLQALFADGAQCDDLEALAHVVEQANRLLAERQDARVTTLEQGVVDFFQWQQNKEPPRYLPTGIKPLSERVDIEAGDYVLLGGTPSSGKTALALQIAQHAAANGYRVGFFSLETSGRKLVSRAVAQYAGVAIDSIKHKRLTQDEWDRSVAYATAARRIRLDVINAAGMSTADIQAYTMAKRYEVVVIDYVQLISAKAATRYEAVTNISMALHIMAQTCNVTVIGLTQLTRQEKGAKKRAPSMSEFRESGQLEQDADVAMILQEGASADRRRLYIVKNKEGRKGYVDLSFDAPRMSFSPLNAQAQADEETNSRGFRKPTAPPKREVDL